MRYDLFQPNQGFVKIPSVAAASYRINLDQYMKLDSDEVFELVSLYFSFVCIASVASRKITVGLDKGRGDFAIFNAQDADVLTTGETAFFSVSTNGVNANPATAGSVRSLLLPNIKLTKEDSIILNCENFVAGDSWNLPVIAFNTYPIIGM